MSIISVRIKDKRRAGQRRRTSASSSAGISIFGLSGLRWSFIKKNYVVWKVLQVYEKTRAIAMLPASFHRFYFAIRGISDNAFATY